MALTITAPADTTKLCSVADVMNELGCSESDESTLDSIIQQASDAIVAYCGRPFAKQTYEETVAGYGDVHLMLTACPIISVSSILCSGVPVTDYTIQEPESGMLYREAGWRWSTQWVSGFSLQAWPQSEEFIFTVAYIAGYDLPDALLPSLPGDIERAAILIAKDWFMNRKRNERVVLAKSEGTTAQYANRPDDNPATLPPTAIRLLSNYRVTV